MNKTLFDLSSEILQLEAQLDDELLTDDQRADLVDHWLEAQDDIATKLDNYAALIEEKSARAQIKLAEARRLSLSAEQETAQVLRLKERLKFYFERHDLKRFATDRYNITLAAHGGLVPLIVPPEWESDPANAPEAFQKRIVQLDKTAIREAIRNDEEAHGARLGERGSSIRIR